MDFCSYSPECVVTLATSISIALFKGMTPDEAGVMGSLLAVVGGQMQYMAAQAIYCRDLAEQAAQESAEKTKGEEPKGGGKTPGENILEPLF